MTVPQPSTDPYSPGDEVTVYIGEEDPDSQYHGTDGVIIERLEDDFDAITDREMDAYLYRVENRATGEILPVDFRHKDLVPTESLSTEE